MTPNKQVTNNSNKLPWQQQKQPRKKMKWKKRNKRSTWTLILQLSHSISDVSFPMYIHVKHISNLYTQEGLCVTNYTCTVVVQNTLVCRQICMNVFVFINVIFASFSFNKRVTERVNVGCVISKVLALRMFIVGNRGGTMGEGRGGKNPLKVSKQGKIRKCGVFSCIKVIKMSFSVIFNKEIHAVEGLLWWF